MNYKKAQLIRVEDALLSAITRVCEGYPTNLGRNSDGEFLMACCEMLRLLFDEKRAL